MIIRNSFILGVFSILSVLLGILRDRLLSTHVGVGPMLDIYNAAFRLPDFLYALSLAFVTAGTVVPFLTIEDKNGDIIDSRHKFSSISLFFAGVASLLGLFIAVTLPLYAKIIVPGFTPEQVVIFIGVTRILMIQPVLLGITSLISCFAQLKNQFVLYGIAPLGYSLGIIFGILYLYPPFGIAGLIYGVLVGALLSVFIQSWSLRGTRMLAVLPYFSWKHIKEFSLLAFPRTGVNVLTQARTIFFTAFATTLGPGALTSYIFAQRITDAVQQVIQQSVTTASLPVLSKEYVENRIGEYKSVVRRYVILLGLIGFFLSWIVYFLRDVIIWILYGTTGAHELISFFLGGFLIILPLQMMIGYYTIGLYSAKDTKSVFYANLWSTIIAVVVVCTTMSFGYATLLYGIIAMAVSNFISIALFYNKKSL